MKVSFDFDDTLDQDDVWPYALELIDRGIDVWIVTARLDDENLIEEYGLKTHNQVILPPWATNEDIYEMARAMRIPRNQIVFTNLLGKGAFFKRNPDFIWHLDDSPKQLFDVQYMSKVKPISVLNPRWQEKCEKLIKKRDYHGYLKK